MPTAASISAIRVLARLPAATSHGYAVRLDRIARGRLTREFAEQLGEACNADDRVVLIRKLKVRGRLSGHSTDDELVVAWARLLADRVLRTADANDKNDDIRVFRDRSEWFVECICDVLARGAVKPTWWYGPLAQVVAGKPVGQAIVELIGYQHAQPLAIIAGVDRRGALDELLGVLSQPERKRLLGRVVGPTAPDAGANDRRRPILAAALELLDLHLAPSEQESLLANWHAHATMDEPDWRNPSALADAASAACRFLQETGRVGRDRLTAAAERGSAPTWLDRSRLRRGLFAGGVTETAALDTIADIIRSAIGGSGGDPDRLALTALSRLSGAGLAGSMRIRRLVHLSALLSPRLSALPAGDRGSAVVSYRNGKGPLAERTGDADEGALRRQIALILEAIVAAPARAACEMPASECSNACAGVAVMLRAFTDFNLAGALRSARITAPSLPQSPDIIAAALLCAWAGADSVHPDGRLDPGISLLLGNRVPDDVADLAAALARIDGSALDVLACTVDRMIAAQHPAEGNSEAIESDLAATALPIDPRLSRIAARLLARWSCWLSGFEQSSGQWLLRFAVRRRGQLVVAGERLAVHVPPLSLDIPLRRAGYLDPLVPPAWLPWKGITFHFDDGGG